MGSRVKSRGQTNTSDNIVTLLTNAGSLSGDEGPQGQQKSQISNLRRLRHLLEIWGRSLGCWMQFINKRGLNKLKSFIWCICTASEIERETSFFPISIHKMWIEKLSLWRSNPLHPQPIPGPRIGWMEPKSLCRIITFVFILPRTRLARESFHKIGSRICFPVTGSGSVYTPQIKELTAEESSVNNRQPTPSH